MSTSLAVEPDHAREPSLFARPMPPPPASEPQQPLDIDYFGSAVQADVVSQLAMPSVAVALPEKPQLPKETQLPGKSQQILQQQVVSFNPVTDQLSDRRTSISAFSSAPRQLTIDTSLPDDDTSTQRLDDASPHSVLNDVDSSSRLNVTASGLDATGLSLPRPLSADATAVAGTALSRLSPLSPLRGTGAAALMRRRRRFANLNEAASAQQDYIAPQPSSVLSTALASRPQNVLSVMGTLPPTT